jgi:hypothetical protein
MGLGLGFRMGMGLRHAVAGGMGGAGATGANRGSDAAGATGPSSLFILSERNFLRRTTKFLIEWPYPVPRLPPKISSKHSFCALELRCDLIQDSVNWKLALRKSTFSALALRVTSSVHFQIAIS